MLHYLAYLWRDVPKRRSPGWNNKNPIADIGKSFGRGKGPRHGGGGRRQARPNRCNRCPALEDRIASLKAQNTALRRENALLRQKVKRRDKKIKGAPKGHPGSAEFFKMGHRRILRVLDSHGRFSKVHIPEIRKIVNQMLGVNTVWDSKGKTAIHR